MAYIGQGLKNGMTPMQALNAGNDVNIFVYGSAWVKGSTDATLGSIEPGFTEFNNSTLMFNTFKGWLKNQLGD